MVEIRACSVTIPSPANRQFDLASITLQAVLVLEPNPPEFVWSVTHVGKSPPSVSPSLGEMVRLIVSFWGYVSRGRKALPPGVETVWKGLQRMQDLARGWDTFGPGAKKSE
jgi:hypothetical protein